LDYCLLASLLEELERALLGLVARLDEVLERLLARRMGLAAHNATLVYHQILLLQATARVLGRAVPDLGTRADRGGLAAHLGQGRGVLARRICGVLVRIRGVLVCVLARRIRGVLVRIRAKPAVHVLSNGIEDFFPKTSDWILCRPQILTRPLRSNPPFDPIRGTDPVNARVRRI